MKRYSASFIALLYVIIVIMAVPGIISASSLPGTIHLDLNQPPLSEPEKKDPVQEKYDEVMSEIQISDEAAEVVENIKGAVEGVQSFTMDVDVAEIRGQRIERVFVHLLASVEHKIARIEFLEPSAMRGQILVADQEKMEVRIYQPINNQIAVRGLEDASNEVLSTLSVADLNTFFDFSEYAVEVLDVDEKDEVCTYKLQVSANEEVWHVSVNSDTWFPHEIVVVEGDVPGTMSISNVVFDAELTAEELAQLPKAKEVRL